MKFAFLPICIGLLSVAGFAQRQPPPPSEDVTRSFASINKQVLDMAEDFPADKYGYRPTPEVRSFGEVIVHVLSGNVYAAKAGRGENAKWEEIDPKTYTGKAEIVAALKKSIDDANSVLKAQPADKFTKTLEPWMGVMEHSAEHYGLLVAYYRLNGMVPPASRPSK